MLTRLRIQNYALIDEADIEFDSHLNIITGETGAGKSILLGALSLILGNRADTQVLFDRERKCVVEGEFSIKKERIKDFLSVNDIDYNYPTIIRREITAEGKSRAFINDTPVNLAILRELTSSLVDIHSQHETLQVMQPAFQLSLVDTFAGNDNLLEKFRERFSKYKKTTAELTALIESEQNSATDLDYFSFQLNELSSANLIPGELEQSETELKTFEHAEEIRLSLASVTGLLAGENDSVIQRLNNAVNLLNAIAKYHHGVESVSARLKSVQIEISDIVSELDAIESGVHYDPEKVQQLKNKIDEINRLLYKHRMPTVEDLISLTETLKKKISAIESSGERIETMKQEKELLFLEMKSMAEQLSASRRKVIPLAEKRIGRLLAELKMAEAVFRIEMEFNLENISSSGADEVQFLFSANKGIGPMPIDKVASGGELSRLMLSIKSSVAKQMQLPTMIFDEIDSGVSGETALKVGNVMRDMAVGHQVIAITHLPQIASRAVAHYIVSKKLRTGKTVSAIELLSEEEHTLEVAKMIAGGKPSAAAIQNAKELIG